MMWLFYNCIVIFADFVHFKIVQLTKMLLEVCSGTFTLFINIKAIHQGVE